MLVSATTGDEGGSRELEPKRVGLKCAGMMADTLLAPMMDAIVR